MLSIVRCSIAAPRLVRTFTQTSRLHGFGSASRPLKTIKYLQVFQKELPHTIWTLVGQLVSPNRVALSSALHNHGLRVSEFKNWNHVLHQSDIQESLKAMGLRSLGHEKDDQPPPWLLLYLVCTKVRTPAQAEGAMMDIVLNNLASLPPDVQGQLLIISMVNLARFNLLLPMRRVVQEFLHIPLRDPSLEFNLLLQAISIVPIPTVESAKQVVTLLTTMEARQLRLRPDTYTHLLRDRFVSLQLTKYLQERMVREGFIPQMEHLDSYLRIFARNGLIHDASRYFEAIRTEAIKTGAPVPMVASPTLGQLAGVPHPANVALLGAHSDRASAFVYLAKLLDAEHLRKQKVVGHPHLRPSMAILRASRSLKPSRLPTKHSVDVYDWTTAFAVAANDPKTTWRSLVRVFERIRTSNDPNFRPTIVTYTVLLRGLYNRKAFVAAEKYWWTLLRSGFIVDSYALGIGLQIITRVGRPHEALAMLEAFASKSTANLPAPHKRYKPVTISIIELNLFMVALNRADRPDIVFKLWDHMYNLYGVNPNHLTLSILLQAVRIAYRLDDSLTAAMAQLAAKNPFRRREQPLASRDDVLASFRRAAGDPINGLRKYRSGLWNGLPPFETARKIFFQVMFGESPGALRAVVPAANAIRQTEGHHSFSELASPFGRHPAPTQLQLPEDLLTAEGRSHYPQIVPTNLNCFDYIALLGVCDRASEIPYVLAWMRTLGIQPTRATLSLALAFWVEVSTQAPLIEHWSGGPTSSEYTKLVVWMEEWVGKSRMPRLEDMRKWTTVAAKMRDPPR